MSTVSTLANVKYLGESVLNISHHEKDGTIDSVFHEVYDMEVYRSPHCGISPGDTVIDGGAHYGLFALYAALSGATEIICFEPDPRTMFELRWNLSKNLRTLDLCPAVRYFDRALWDGELPIEFRPAKTASAGSHVVLPGLRKKAGDIFVQTMSLDSLNLKKVDVIKLDIEGSELQALLGMRNTIRRCRPKLMISIYHHRGDATRLPALIDGYDMGYKYETSDADGKHVTGFWY